MGRGPQDEHVYNEFNRLLVRGGLKAFIESHGEFTWNSKGHKGMVITWAPGVASASGGAATHAQAPQAPSGASASSTGPAPKATPGGAAQQWT